MPVVATTQSKGFHTTQKAHVLLFSREHCIATATVQTWPIL